MQQWRAVGDTVFDLTDPGFEPRTSRTDSNALTTELTGRSRDYYKHVISSYVNNFDRKEDELLSVSTGTILTRLSIELSFLIPSKLANFVLPKPESNLN